MDEIQKQRVIVAVVALNLTAMAYQFGFNRYPHFTYAKLALAIGLGLVAGGIAYVVTKLLQK
jgi:hypothetical protein